jgi:hypothetical protein
MTCQVMETACGGPQAGAMSTISAGPTRTSAVEAADALRTTLRLNAATSLLGGLAATAAAGPVDRLLGTGEPGWVRVTGVGLLLFAGGVAATSGATVDRLAQRTPLISAADATWVAASAATIAAGWYSARGTAIVAAGAVGVAAFCAGQLVLVRRLA